ncbi:hypothetical protein CMV_025137 [Castanea mollissima]|uniref:Uncharacterized protein n=1 Tax=Castanea mollissima TaxID=60419 RepID=A0A8J4QD26_9ROSI|nr:hypothetical protein CMV_025137 [Castanea mollissima]
MGLVLFSSIIDATSAAEPPSDFQGHPSPIINHHHSTVVPLPFASQPNPGFGGEEDEIEFVVHGSLLLIGVAGLRWFGERGRVSTGVAGFCDLILGEKCQKQYALSDFGSLISNVDYQCKQLLDLHSHNLQGK